MTLCCRRKSERDYETINDAESTKKVSSWRGQKISYCCGGPFPRQGANVVLHLTVLAVFAACSSVFPLLILNPHRENVLESSGDDKGIVGICVAGLAMGCITSLSCVAEAGTFCDLRKKRWYPSPCTAFTAALVTVIALTALFEREANQQMQNYISRNTWVNETVGAMEQNCTNTVWANQGALTSSNCTFCAEDYFVNPFNGPYQSILLPHVDVSFCRVDFPSCGLQLDWFHNILSNWTVPGKSYLCGVHMTETTGSTTDAWEHSMCVQSFLAKQLGLFPPMILNFTKLNDICGNLEGFATFHSSLLARCYPHGDVDRECDTPYAAAFFEEVQTNLSFIQNQSLPFPERAHQVITLANSPALGLALKLPFAITIPYELVQFLLRNFVVKIPR